MPQFSTKRRVHQSAKDMFDLVADAEKYPQFLPMCESLRVRSRTEKENGVAVVVASMTVAYKIIRESFTTRVTLDRPSLKVLVEYLDGPFKRLQNRWSFRPAGEYTCDVEFFIDYEFRNRALSLLMGALFDTVFRKYAAAFERRADQIYGRKTA